MSLSQFEYTCVSSKIEGVVLTFILFLLWSVILIYEFDTTMGRKRHQQKTHPKVVDLNLLSESMLDQPRKRYGQQTDCPICMDGVKYEVETNCGHVFCCQCWINYVAQFSYLNAILCPYCRKNVDILYQCFNGAKLKLNPPSNSEPVEKEIDKILHEIESYNHRCNSEPTTSSMVILHFLQKIAFFEMIIVWVCLFVFLMHMLYCWLITTGSQPLPQADLILMGEIRNTNNTLLTHE